MRPLERSAVSGDGSETDVPELPFGPRDAKQVPGGVIRHRFTAFQFYGLFCRTESRLLPKLGRTAPRAHLFRSLGNDASSAAKDRKGCRPECSHIDSGGIWHRQRSTSPLHTQPLSLAQWPFCEG